MALFFEVEEISNKVFTKAGVEGGYSFERKYSYPSDITPLMERTKDQFALLQVRDNRPEAFYYGNQAYTFKEAFYIYENDRSPECFDKNCVEKYFISDGSIAYLFQI